MHRSNIIHDGEHVTVALHYVQRHPVSLRDAANINVHERNVIAFEP